MSRLTESARGRRCVALIPGICNYQPETVVLSHLNGGGMGIKQGDLFGCFACSACHAWLDSGWARDKTMSRERRDLFHVEAILRTQAIWLDEGLILITGEI